MIKKIALMLVLLYCTTHAHEWDVREVVYQVDAYKTEVKKFLKQLKKEGIQYYFDGNGNLHIILPKEISKEE